MPELATLTGARAGHTNGWHGPQAGSRLRLGWQALVDCRFRTTWGFGGGCGCKLLGWEVVLFKPKRCVFFVLFLVVSCAVCCANFCDQIIREVVHFLCSFCMGSCAFDIFYLFQKHGREHKKNTTASKGFPFAKFVP